MKKIALFFIVLFMAFTVYAQDWSGTYYWKNPSADTNNGKNAQFLFRVEKVQDNTGTWYKVYDLSYGSELLIFPIDNPSDKGKYMWHSYKETTPQTEAFRKCFTRLAVKDLKLNKWRVSEMTHDSESGYCRLEVNVFIFVVGLGNQFNFRIDPVTGKRQMVYTITPDKAAQNGMYRNTSPGSEGDFVYVMTEV